MQRALYDPVDTELLGSLDPSRQFRVNGEVYRFGSERTMRRFMADPMLYCGLLRDPVTGRRFFPSVHSPNVYYVGGPYVFERDSTLQEFLKDPHRYEVVRGL